jgi:hypothetical protein
MTDRDWSEIVERERLAVDNEFAAEVAESRFSRSEWGVIMTVVEFEVRDPEDPERARLVGDTSRVESVLPQIEKVGQGPSMGAAPTPDPDGGPNGSDDSGSGGGFLDRVLSLLGSGSDDTVLDAADELVQAYAETLQAHLEEQGKWEEVRTAAGRDR